MIKSVQKAMNILKVLSDNEPKSTTLKSISEKTQIEKPTCSHLLETLCAEGYALRVSQAKGYKLGPATYCLTRYGKYEESLVSSCHPVLCWLSKKTNGISILAVIDNCEKYIIDYVDNDNVIFKNTGNIFTDDIYRTATGRIILSQLDKEALYDIYKKHGKPKDEDWSNINSFEDLKAELEKIKKQKVIVTSKNQGKTYDIGLGKAIFKGKKCVGAIGIAHCYVENSAEFFKSDIFFLEKAANEITRRLNYAEF